MKKALLVNEAGYGLGHVARLTSIAQRLQEDGWEISLCSFRSAFQEHFRAKLTEFLPAPGWPGLMGENWFHRPHDPKEPANSFAAILSYFGAADDRVIASHLRAWDSLLRLTKPSVVVGDFAPGAMLASHGRMPTVSVGTGFTVPAIHQGRYVPYKNATANDYVLGQRVADAVISAFRQIHSSAPDNPFVALRGQEAFPICYRAFDPGRGLREERVVPPATIASFETKGPIQSRRVCIYFGPDIQPYAHVLTALAQLCPKPLLYVDPNVRRRIDLKGFDIRDRLFTAQDLSGICSLLIHHGGLGISQLGAATGTPQLVIFHDVEKWLNAQAIGEKGAGAGLSLRDASKDRIGSMLEKVTRDSIRTAAKRWASELAAEQLQEKPEDHIVDELRRRGVTD